MQINLTKNKKTKVEDHNLGFGKIFTDHMFVMDYTKEKGWHNAMITPFENISISPACNTLHYGQSIFEGMKAYVQNGKIALFRPLDNFTRMNESAKRMALPTIDENFILNALEQLLIIEKDWIPTSEGTSLYIRPFMFGIDESLGVHPNNHIKFMIILSPSGAYFKDGLQPNKIFVENSYVRAVRGGMGFAKTAGNYACSLKGQEKAENFGYSQTLWLDAIEQKYIEEVGAMNIFFRINDTFITPELNGSILSGITRKSVISIIKDLGFKLEERKISLQEIYDAADNNELKEVFWTGTAAVIAPVGELFDGNKKIIINNFEIGEYSQKIYNILTGIQTGKVEDKFNWVHIVD